MEEKHVELGDIVSDDYDEEEELWDDNEEYIGPEVVLFNLEY
jgi:hypothetical protein